MKNSLIVLVCVLSVSCNYNSSNEDNTRSEKIVITGKDYIEEIKYVKKFSKENGYEDKQAFFVDFSRPSNVNRMFLVDLNENIIVGDFQFLVAHGSGCGQTNGVPNGFSNEIGSNCSSLGLSVIEKRDYSNWGVNIKYWLKGLNLTNDNMTKRLVVLHSWEGIPETIVKTPITQSQGCFTISNREMELLDDFIQRMNYEGKLLVYAFR